MYITCTILLENTNIINLYSTPLINKVLICTAMKGAFSTIIR